MSSRQQQQRREPWRNVERHYCSVCNVWMGSDRQSIMLHENGKKHKENVELALKKKRSEKLQTEKEQNFLQASLKKMEHAALQSHQTQGNRFGPGAHHHHHHIPPPPPPSSTFSGPPPYMHSMNNTSSSPVVLSPPPIQSQPPPPPPPQQQSMPTPENIHSKSDVKSEWAAKSRKNQRRNEKDDDDDDEQEVQQPNKKRRLQPGEGTHEANGNTYLDGSVFFEILETDLPIQLWTGQMLATTEEKRLPEKEVYWKDAIVAAAHRRKKSSSNGDDVSPPSPIVHVSYLSSMEDEDETIEKNVDLGRIRIILGAHENIPDTVEEARLLQMGGEEVQIESSDGDGCTKQKPAVDESTGFSGWSAVSIKRTTVRNELKEERERLRETRREKQIEKEAQAKESEARRMEEAKVADADDSALGAYDVWGKGGYKGIDITGAQEANDSTTVADTIVKKHTSAGGDGGKKTSFAFKKKKKLPNKRQTRVTSADDR